MQDLYFRIYGDYPAGPVFFPREQTPWLAAVEAQWRTVLREFETYRRARGQALPMSFVPDDVVIEGWRSVGLLTYTHLYRDPARHFPETMALLRTIPDLTSAFINVLEPHASLPPHNGDTNTTYRCHLGLIVPGDVDACGLEVGGERIGWHEGVAFAFDEAHRHWVWNHTDRERVVLVFDVLRPAYRTRKLAVCGAVLGAITLTLLETRCPPLRRLPAALRRLLHRALGRAAAGYLYVRDGTR